MSIFITASNGASGMSVTLGESYENLADSVTYSVSASSGGFSMPVNGRIKYDGLLAARCIVSARFSLRQDPGVLLGASLYLNGSQIEDSIILDPWGPAILNYPITLQDNDYLELWANVYAGDAVILAQCQLSVFSGSLI